MPTPLEVEAMLTGPGGPFEVIVDEVRGVPMKTYKDRMTALRQVAQMAIGRGDDQTYIVYGERRIGFGEFLRTANGISGELAGIGVGHGDRVAVLSANNPEWCLTFWATVDMGAILVGLNGWWKADEILFGLADSGSKVLVADGPRLERLKGRLDELTDLEQIYLVGDGDVSSYGDARVRPFAELMGAPTEGFPDIAIDEDDPAVIFYTSGTTGRPKGAVSTHRSMIANLQSTVYGAIARAMSSDVPGGLGGADGHQSASLLTSPLFHVSGCHSGLVVALMAGVKIVVPVGKFEPEMAMQLIQDEHIETWATVPTMVWRVVEHPERHSYDLSSVSTVAYGGSPSAAELQRRVQETFPKVKTLGNAYGLTESSSVATAIFGDDFLARPDSVGRAMPVVDLQVVTDDGTVQAPGELGEVWIKGPIIMPGYWNRPDANAEVLVDGWLRTGDIGYVDDEGFLYITDRAKDMIIRGGENVYCAEIENRLAEHPAIAEAAIIGVAHPTLGEEVKAVIRPEPGQSVTAEEAKAWVA
ncbi:MAG TPA: class I adenylate-forming enzyme family protein, partial [Acidimicrobiales bacterium]|nr:class I adenylate-forming enzyme family protein [Acidimicrobiales bacterium]